MASFQFIRSSTIEEASDILRERPGRAFLLAGGTDLIVEIQKGRKQPEWVLDAKRLRGLDGDIVFRDGALRIGALAVMTDVLEHAEARTHFPALCEALRVIGSVQIRNRATIPGNICHASPAADSAPPLLVYDARIFVFNARSGRRTVSIREFFLGPGRTALAPGDIVEEIEIPRPPRDSGAAFLRLARRRGMDLSSISAACVVDSEGRARFAFGAVGPTPLLLPEEPGCDGPATPELRERLSAGIRPISDIRAGAEYRHAMAAVIGARALAVAQARRRKGA